jgi:hypothetical protein
MHFASRVRTWRVARLYNVQCNSSISETVRNRTHLNIHCLLRMTDTMTSQNADLCSSDTIYIVTCMSVTIDGVGIRDWKYLPLTDRNYN